MASSSATTAAPRPNHTALPLLESSPGPTISTRSSSRFALRDTYNRDALPPSTPRNHNNTRALRKGKEPAARRQEKPTGDRPAPSASAASAYNPRHSHGLSWSSTTRDSVVDNLLLSLDELSMQMKGTFGSAGMHDYDDDAEREKDRVRQAPLHAMTRPVQRARGHTYSSSLSSEYNPHGAQDSPSSKYSSPVYRSRRSNSSSNVAAHNASNARMKAPSSKFTNRTTGRPSGDTERTTRDSPRAKPSYGHSRDDSDNSFANIGYSAIQESGRLAWGGAGRSVSMDHIYAEAHGGNSVMERGRPVPSMFSSYENASDAAPEPMVPAGPRKMQNPTATGPVYVNQATKNSALRKITTQSDLRSASNPTIPQDVRDRASEFVRNNSLRGDQAVPSLNDHSATNSISSASRRKDAPSPHRERPGFFKRVFGSSSRSAERAESPQHSYESPPVNRKPSAMSSGSGSNLRNELQQLPSETLVSASHFPAALNKKPSSFFRRRKRSVGDTALPPPALPLHVSNANREPAQQSPSVSSLRKVMDPYISTGSNLAPGTGHSTPVENSRPHTGDSRGDTDSLDMFHSGYTPPPDASLGKRDPMSREMTARPSQDTESPKLKVRAKKRPDPIPTISMSRASQGSFLRDASAERPAAVSPMAFYSPMENMNPKVSPMSEKHPSEGELEGRPASRASTGDRIIASKGNSPVEPSQEMRDFTAGHNVDLDMHGNSWLMTRDAKHDNDRPDANKTERLYLQPTDSEEEKEKNHGGVSIPARSRQTSRSESMSLSIAAHHSPATPASRYHSASSLPLVQVDGNDAPRPSVDTQGGRATPQSDQTMHKERARRIFNGDEEDVNKMEAASWLGENKPLNMHTLGAYMLLFNFTDMNIIAALRTLCGKLVLKGETQQFDRIITALSARWCECNANHGFKAQDVVHTIFYSLILLNTDLHMADIGDKMSKSAYVKNTLPTIRRVVSDAAPNAFEENLRAGQNNQSRPSVPWPDSTPSMPSSPALPPDTPQERTSFETSRQTANKRMSIRPGMFRADSEGWTPDSANSSSSNALVNGQWTGPMRSWEFEIEVVLKSFFTSIRNEPLPLLNLSVADVRPSDRNLTVAGLKRTGSVVSKAPSEAMSYRSKPGLRNLALGWQGRNTRSRQKMYPSSTVGSSRTSFDDDSSIWSPAQSSTWSKNSFGKTLASSSVGSLGHHLGMGDASFKHSIGFANALSQAIIREEGVANGVDTDSVTIKGDLLEDESLTLEGAPWAKEGMLKHRHQQETFDRKAKDRSWGGDVFAVISKGKLTLFNFNAATKSRSFGRQRLQKGAGSRANSMTASRVGGGDWMENAEQIASYALRHTIASVLPKPGFSKSKPYVWALSLPSGAAHLFEVGTPEIASEWMRTANYWSARLSKEPLSGGVSNIEYGWSDQVINTALIERSESFSVSSPPPSIMNRQRTHTHSSSSGGFPRPSTQSSLRSSFDVGGGPRTRMPGDKVQLADWQEPSQSMMASQLMEVDQQKGMTAYVANAELELAKHNELKHAIELAYSPRAPNAAKAMANWQRKSEYLLREIVKFRTYIDSLSAAQKAKEEVLVRRAEREAFKNGARTPTATNGQWEFLNGDTPTTVEFPTRLSEKEEGRDITPRQSHVPAA